MENIKIGGFPLPIDAEVELDKFITWLTNCYHLKEGISKTSLFWEMSHFLANRIVVQDALQFPEVRAALKEEKTDD
jgi:hypothetical protein